jgi:hypothetical protein
MLVGGGLSDVIQVAAPSGVGRRTESSQGAISPHPQKKAHCSRCSICQEVYAASEDAGAVTLAHSERVHSGAIFAKFCHSTMQAVAESGDAKVVPTEEGFVQPPSRLPKVPRYMCLSHLPCWSGSSGVLPCLYCS